MHLSHPSHPTPSMQVELLPSNQPLVVNKSECDNLSIPTTPEIQADRVNMIWKQVGGHSPPPPPTPEQSRGQPQALRQVPATISPVVPRSSKPWGGARPTSSART